MTLSAKKEIMMTKNIVDLYTDWRAVNAAPWTTDINNERSVIDMLKHCTQELTTKIEKLEEKLAESQKAVDTVRLLNLILNGI